jgi:Spy/CpxP family protein refolding chaperone
MKSTKTLLIATLAAGALLAGSAPLFAQESTNTPPPGMKAGRHDIAKELNLTDDQKPKFQEIMKSTRDKMKDLREDTTLTQEEKKAKAKTIQEDTTTQMKALLTPDQFTKWQELTKRHRPGPPAGTPPPTSPQN